MSAKSKFVIDCDPGIDDAHAILMCLKEHEKVDIVGITCIGGNVPVKSVCSNALYLLHTFAKNRNIPVFRGSSSPLVVQQYIHTGYHGDHFGGFEPSEIPAFETSKEHAVDALARLSKEYQGQLTLVALGPLTNIALTMRLDPDFTKRLARFVIMGGNMHGRGNITACAEFNFYNDPEAAYVVLEESSCIIDLATWEFCKFDTNEFLTYEWFKKWLSKHPNSERGEFFRKLMSHHEKLVFIENKTEQYNSCDAVAMAVALYPSLVKKSEMVTCTVEIAGNHSRGMTVVDRDGLLKKRKNVRLIQELDNAQYTKILETILDF